MILTCFQRPLQACVSNVASPADLLGLFNLEEGRASVPNREEQLRILIQTGGPIPPIHGVPTPNFAILCYWCSDPREPGKSRVLYTEALNLSKTFKYRQAIQEFRALAPSHSDRAARALCLTWLSLKTF